MELPRKTTNSPLVCFIEPGAVRIVRHPSLNGGKFLVSNSCVLQGH